MSPVGATRLIVAREVVERLRSRLIWVMTALTAALVVGIIVVPPLVREPAQPTVVGLVGPSAQALGPRLQAAARTAKVAVDVVDVPSGVTARARVGSGSLGVALSLDDAAAVAQVKDSLSPEVAALLKAVLDGVHREDVLRDAGVPASTVAAASARVKFTVTALEPSPPDRAARSIAAIAAGILLYVSLGAYGAAVAGGVAQEKTSRTAEVLLAAVRPSQLLQGKVVGIGLCGLAQLGVAVAAGLIANAVVQAADIPSTVWVLLPVTLLWFALGFVLYGLGYAAAGALVARQEEVQFVTLPIGMLLFVSFLLTYAAIGAPGAWWIKVLSFVPPFAPILMPARLALGSMAVWEMPVAVLFVVASVWGIAHLAARIYAGAIVRSGARLSWRAALRLRGE